MAVASGGVAIAVASGSTAAGAVSGGTTAFGALPLHLLDIGQLAQA
ncbi:MAG: hypothetical protein GX900_05505 [Clostridiaceae bacterium]|nr:hypothetical protein [Clostridiaceae bacterium]